MITSIALAAAISASNVNVINSNSYGLHYAKNDKIYLMNEGVESFNSGYPIESNPYAIDVKKSVYWEMGFVSAERLNKMSYDQLEFNDRVLSRAMEADRLKAAQDKKAIKEQIEQRTYLITVVCLAIAFLVISVSVVGGFMENSGRKTEPADRV